VACVTMHVLQTRITAVAVAVMVASLLALDCSAMHGPVRELSHKYHGAWHMALAWLMPPLAASSTW